MQNPSLRFCRHSGVRFTLRCFSNSFKKRPKLILFSSTKRFPHSEVSREVDSGNIHINWSPLWRTDGMPYGDMKQSGFGREGPKYGIEGMTEMKAVVIHSQYNLF